MEKGQTLGIVGPKNSGISTLFELLTTQTQPDNGTIYSYGEKASLSSKFYKNAGIFTKKSSLWKNLSIQDHLDIFQMLYKIDY